MKETLIEYTINAQKIIYLNRPKRLSSGKNCTSHVGLSRSNPSDQMVIGTVRQEAGSRERRPKALKSKLAHGGPLVSSPLRSDGSSDGQARGWTALTVVKSAQGSVGKQL